MDNLYQWFIKRNFDSKLVREKYLDKLEKYEKWLEDERSLKWAKATYHFCSGYIINRDGHKVRAMCRVHKETNIKSSLKILTDSGYWVSDESLNVNDMVIQRYDLTFPENL